MKDFLFDGNSLLETSSDDSGEGGSGPIVQDGEPFVQQLAAVMKLPEASLIDDLSIDYLLGDTIAPASDSTDSTSGNGTFGNDDTTMHFFDDSLFDVLDGCCGQTSEEAMYPPISLSTEMDVNLSALPPSPANSETSSASSTSLHGQNQSGALNRSFSMFQPQAIAPSVGSVVSVSSDLATAKIPIPRITKPGPKAKVKTPLVLTAAAPLPVVIKTEPAWNGLSGGGLPTMMTSVHFQGNGVSLVKPNATESLDRSLKRQHRLIRNRESACLSRKKKREFLASLENRLNDALRENRELKHENSKLRTRIEELEGGRRSGAWTLDSVLRTDSFRLASDGLTTAKKKKGTALFAFVVLVVLNTNLSGLYLSSTTSEVLIPSRNGGGAPMVRRGRSLLWNDDLDANATAPEGLGNLTVVQPSLCLTYPNQTESIRLDSQLRGWFGSDVLVGNRTLERLDGDVTKNRRPDDANSPRQKKRRFGRLQPPTDLDRVKPKLTGSFYHLFTTAGRRKALSSFYGSEVPRFTYESFFESINRREDTFYVVSFSGDHLLLPATAKNRSSRPRMSLIMPSVQLNMNDSMQPPPHHVAMMKIDCEVINTKLVHVSEDAIPFRGQSPSTMMNSSNYGAEKNSTNEDRSRTMPSNVSRITSDVGSQVSAYRNSSSVRLDWPVRSKSELPNGRAAGNKTYRKFHFRS